MIETLYYTKVYQSAKMQEYLYYNTTRFMFYSMDNDSGMIYADLRIIPSGVYEFKCRVIDNYIKDSQCALRCNIAGGTEKQLDACKDKCRVKAAVVSDVIATIKTIGEGPVWSGASIRLKGNV